MSRRNLLIVVFSVVMGFVALLGYVWQPEAPKEPVRIALQNNGGLVVFDHQRHAEKFDVACEECHHTGSFTKCDACHGISIDEAFVKNHKNSFDTSDCLTCHHQGFEKTVRAHAMHPALIKQNCQYCHHKRFIEKRPTNCSKCHKAEKVRRRPSLMDAGHERCSTCHDNIFEGKSEKSCGFCHNSNGNLERFKNGESVDFASFSVPCGECHKGVKPDSLIPNVMNAYHQSCIDCHQKKGKGPFAKNQCRQCHTN